MNSQQPLSSRTRRLAGLCLALFLAGALLPAADPVVAFVNVTVLPMDDDRVLADHTVLVRGNRIVEVGPSARVKVPEGATRVDGRDRFLLPGLAEMHGHIPPPSAPADYTEAVLFMYVANGVTTVRGMLGAPNQLPLRDRASRGEIVAPTLYLAGPSFNDASINSPQEAVDKVRQQKAEGWDLLKIHPGLTRAEYDAMARTAGEVGIRFGGHVPADVGLLHALEMQQETIDHLDGYIEHLGGEKGPVPEAKLIEVADKTRAAGTWVVPTLALWDTLMGAAPLEGLTGYAELKYMPPDMVRTWTAVHEKRLSDPQYSRARADHIAQNRRRLLGVMSARGVKILLGTDAPQQFSVPGFSIHREMSVMVEAGLTPLEILRSGTKIVGDYFAAKDRFGTIAAGQRADLLLVTANPLDDVAYLARRAGVMVRGRWLPEAAIQERLAQIAASYSASR